MTQTPLPFGEWRPDVALLDTQFATVADNVIPHVNGYEPLSAQVPLNPAITPLPAKCFGLYAARKADGTWKIYAGTLTKLYLWTPGTGWTDVSRLAGGNYAVVTGWSFAQFGTNLYACSGVNDVLQSIDIEAGVNFAASAGSPPAARTIGVVGEFLVLAGLATNPRQIEWSSINNPTAWVVGVNLCDVQEFPEGGPVQGISGSESVGYVVQDRMIRTAQFLPGDTTFIFSFTRSVKERGCVSQMGFTTVADILYYVAQDGIHALANSQSVPIGQDKVSDWFLENSDPTRRNLTLCIQATKVYVIWAFFSSGAALNYDRLLIYNWANQRFTTASFEAQAFALCASTALDEETTGGDTGDSSADSTAPSMDSPTYMGGVPFVATIDVGGNLCQLSFQPQGSGGGNNLGATLETAEVHLVPGQRAFVSDVYPLIDSANAMVTPATRDRLGDPIVYGQPVPIEVTGSAGVFRSARLHRYRVTLPPGDGWTKAEGVVAEVQPDGFA